MVRFIERRYRPLYFALLACFVLFGVCVAIIGATLPRILGEFGWSYTATGAVLASGSTGYFLSAFLSGVLVHSLGVRRMLVLGLGLQAAGLSLFAAWPDVLANAVLYFLVGVGQGATEVAVNVCVVRMERDGRSRLMNLMHAAFCVGAIGGPFAVAALLSVWRLVYRLMAFGCLLMAAMLWTLPFSRLKPEHEDHRARPRVGEVLREPLLVLCAIILLLYVGSELGASAWVARYYEQVLRTRAFVGVLMVSVFWTGLLAGRLGLSLGYHGTRQAEWLLVLAVTCTAGLLAALVAPGPWLAGAGFFIAGVGYSATYPLVMALLGKHVRRGHGVALGFASMGGGIGAFTFPLLVGPMMDRFGVRSGFFVYIAANLAMVALAGAVLRRVRALERRAARAP